MKSGKKNFALSISLCLLFSTSSLQQLLGCPCSEIKVPEAAPELSIKEGLAYMKTAAYKSEIQQAVKEARKVCLEQLGKKGDKESLAIVSDIDETLLDNSEYFRTQSSWDGWDDWVVAARAKPIKPTADLIAWARKNGIAIFLITGRKEKDRGLTIKNLVNAGLVYDGLYLRGNNDESPAAEMKVKYRKQIEAMGFKIIVSMGDQYSDLLGGHALDCQKLPNKIYFIK